MVAHVQAVHGVSERRSCVVLGVDRSSIRYVSHRPDQTALMLRIRDLAATRTRYGYFRIYILAIDVDQGIKGEQVVEAMTRIAYTRGAPKTIRVDNGPEFISKALDRWAYENGVTLDFSRPGKPTDNAFVESLNGRLRDECLNAHWFLSLADARAKIEA